MPRPAFAPRGTENKRNNVILSGYYGGGNLGDDLLMLITISALRDLFPGWGIFVCDRGDTRCFKQLGPHVVFTGIESIPADQSRSKTRRVIAYFSAWARLLSRSRWLVVGGGTVFHPSIRGLLIQNAVYLIARLRGVRIAALGVGVADMRNPISRWLVRRIVAMSALFLVRDEAALRQCRGTRAQLTSDLVFACAELQTAESAEPLWKRGDPATIGLTVSPEAFDQSSFEPAMTALAEWVKSCGSMGHRVVFLELLRAGVTTGDVALFDRIAANLGRGLAVERRRLMPDAAAIAEAFHDINLVCGTRYHGLVLAAMLNRPFVGLTHENKITDICNTFGMPCLEAGTVCGSTLAAVVADTLPRRPNANVVAALAKDAQRNFDAFAAVIRVRDRAAVA